jgi:hypothetical protein
MHVVDGFLTLPATVSATAEKLELEEFLEAMDKAGITDRIDRTGNSTVFIPKDMALDSALLPSDIANILA